MTSSLFGYRNSPSRTRWDQAADALGFAVDHRRTSRSMDGRIGELDIEVLEIPGSPLMMFAEIEPEEANGLPPFAVQLRADLDPAYGQLRHVATGDLTFDHQLMTFGVKANRVLDYLSLDRRDVLLELYQHLIIGSVTHEGVRATLELDDWVPEELVVAVTLAADIVERFYHDPSAPPLEITFAESQVA